MEPRSAVLKSLHQPRTALSHDALGAKGKNGSWASIIASVTMGQLACENTRIFIVFATENYGVPASAQLRCLRQIL